MAGRQPWETGVVAATADQLQHAKERHEGQAER